MSDVPPPDEAPRPTRPPQLEPEPTVGHAPVPSVPSVPSVLVTPGGQTLQVHGVRAVLDIVPFRRLWLSLGLSSFGDWLGLLATTAMAASLGAQSGYAQANLAVSGVLILRLAPAVFFGPFAGLVADRLDRKLTMVVGDLLRFALFASIPLVGTLWWLFVATVLVEIVGLFWMPAKDATVPNLVPRERLESANQLSLATTYGSAPFAALLFSGLALVSGVIDEVLPFVGNSTNLALYVNALTYLVAAFVIWKLDMPRGPSRRLTGRPESVWRTIVDGWAFVGKTKLVRGLVIGMLGAFGAGGFVIGVGPTFASDLGAGGPGYGILFASVFTGLAVGMWIGPRLLAELTRWRLFSLSIVVAGFFLALLALIPNIVLASLFTAMLGAGAGVAWVTGYTLLGLEVADELRGRTFAFVQTAARVVLIAVMAFAPALAALIGSRPVNFTDTVTLQVNGTGLTLLVAALLAAGIGVLSYRTMNDGLQLPLLDDLVGAWQRRHVAGPVVLTKPDHDGFFVAFEGGDGVGKSTQIRHLETWLRDDLGHEVVVTREPGATGIGEQIRKLVLHGDQITPRAEALLFAADRAHHVATVVRPALERGAIVVSDRYMDSSIAYQGAGRDLDPDGIAQISRWATGSLLPDLTVLLDLDPEAGRARLTSDGVALDKLEGEGAQFHERVRRSFLSLARRSPRRYLVVDARADVAAISEEVRARLAAVLPLSERRRLEAERLERERVEKEQRAAEEAESRRLEAERGRLEAERVESERIESERIESERIEAERIEAERVAAVEAERRRLDAEAALGYVAQTLPTPEGGAVAVNPRRDDTASRRPPRADPPTEVDLGEELFSLGDDPWHPR